MINTAQCFSEYVCPCPSMHGLVEKTPRNAVTVSLIKGERIDTTAYFA